MTIPIPSAPPRDPAADETFDVFVSYAHADDEVPPGAARGWVTTLVDAVKAVLRRKLGGAGAKVWMDHQLAANQPVTAELRRRVSGSRTLLLVLSRGYLESEWCRRELADFVAQAALRGDTQAVFAVEIDPIERELWPAPLLPLTPMRFWEQRPDEKAPRLAGFPCPKPEEDSPYWTRVNELAHLIAQRLRAEPAPARQRLAVVVAETTDDLDEPRQLVVSSLHQHGGAVVLPAAEYPRGTEADFLDGVRHDLRRAALFVQLLGPHPGRKPRDGALGFVALQAREAQGRQGLRTLQWRAPGADPARVSDPVLRDLLAGPQVSGAGFEEFRQAVLRAVDELLRPSPATPARQIAAALPPIAAMPMGELEGAEGLSLYLQAAPEDRDLAEAIAGHLAAAGVNVLLSPKPKPVQTFEEALRSQEKMLRLSHGVLLLYGNSSEETVFAAFQYTQRIFGLKRTDVWCAVLDLAPTDELRVPIRSRNLVTIDCRQGFEPARLDDFFGRLRAAQGVAHA